MLLQTQSFIGMDNIIVQTFCEEFLVTSFTTKSLHIKESSFCIANVSKWNTQSS